MTTNKLPVHVQQQIHCADTKIKQLSTYKIMHPKRGPKPKETEVHFFAFFVGGDEQEASRQLDVFLKAVGPKYRGNKRLGKRHLYADLVRYFFLLKRNGVTLPRNKSLSKRACQYGLGKVLRSHDCTDLSDNMIMESGKARKSIADKMDRIFSHVANHVENTPA